MSIGVICSPNGRRVKHASMIHRLLPLAWAASLLAIGCAAQPQYMATTSVRAQPKPENCSFDILTTRPQRIFDELGIIDFTGGLIGQNGRRAGLPDNAAELKEKTARSVCDAGGDAVLAEVNGLGQYIRATVIRYKPE
ncbi:MAG: hypothetical protein ACJ79H_15010 [Myxococcales bacterium]